jgi:rubrerythrin
LPSSSGDKVCPICDSPLQPGSKKCGFCGTDLSIFDIDVEAPKPAPAAPAPSPAPKPSVESRIEEIFSKPLVPEKPAQAKAESSSVTREWKPPGTSSEEPAAETQPEPEPVAEAVEAEEIPVQPAKEAPREVEYFECPQCGTAVEMTASSCPKCGVLFAEEGADVFQCPNCNAMVNVDAKTCPGCGAMFVEPEEAEQAAQPAPAPKEEIEAPVVLAPKAPEPESVKAEPKVEEEKKGFLSLFRRSKKEEPSPAPPKPTAPAKPAPAAVQPAAKAPAPAPPRPIELHPIRKPAPTEAAPVKDKGKELARMVAEMKPLLALAREKEVDIGESKELIDEAATAGRERQLEKAIELVQKSKVVLMSKIDTQLSEEIDRLNDEIRVARDFGGDISRATTYTEEIARARSSGDAEAAYVYVDKVKSELLPITGRYNDSRKKLSAIKELIGDAEFFIVDTKDVRGLMVDASKALDVKDFDKFDTLARAAQDRLYRDIPPRINDEMRKARDQLLDAKMKSANITPMITVLKSASNLVKVGDYAQALKEMREFRNLISKI